MADRVSKERRSWNMSRICSKDTSPEMRVRLLLHRKGYRFRLHDKNLPGSPDVVLKKHRTVIFVHGCYWHRHQACKAGSYFPKDPKQGFEFWHEKFRRNVKRDELNKKQLEKAGWRVEVVWECQTKKEDTLSKHLESLFE